MTNKLLSSLRVFTEVHAVNWLKTVIGGIRRRHRDRKAPYRVMTPWEAERMFGNQSYRWRYRLNGGRDV